MSCFINPILLFFSMLLNYPDYFPEAFDFLLIHEGKQYTYNSNDEGGPTKYGISLRFIKENHLNMDLNKDNKINYKDVQKIDEKEAYTIYKNYFWDYNNLDKIIHKELAIKIFDTCVNMGSDTGIKLIQKVLNATVLKDKDFEKLVEDGKLGENTLKAINETPKDYIKTVVLPDYRWFCLRYYEKLVKGNPALSIFLADWKRRAFS